ncbi:MAG: hypothetical protein GY864_05980 [Desulfobacterales bacterium]|nr:hypothetical protein [Desulfobacterales bacterium]
MSKGKHRTEIIIAIVGLIGVLGGALFTNWDKIFPKKAILLVPKPGIQIPATTSPKLEKKTEPEIIPVEKTIKAVGCWKQGGGDGNMDTNSKDYVPASATTELFLKDNLIKVNIDFSCEEYRGNNTTFSGNKDFLVYEPPKGKKILNFEGKGGRIHTFSGNTTGKNHKFNAFKGTEKTYWKSLSFRVDSSKHNDGPHVGVKGVLALEVKLVK